MPLLGVDMLYSYCDLEISDFETTDELGETSEIIRDYRALKAKAISFGIGIKKEGCNLYAMGKLGSEKDGVAYDYL